jgi:NADH-quinone oxidoreductase subunit G
VQDVWPTALAESADVVLSAATFAEKAGCYVNARGRLQYAEAALPPRDGSLPDLDILAILVGRGAGPIRSGDVLAEVAANVPAFAGAEGGKVPPFGLVLDEPAPASNGAKSSRYIDPWMMTRNDRG